MFLTFFFKNGFDFLIYKPDFVQYPDVTLVVTQNQSQHTGNSQQSSAQPHTVRDKHLQAKYLRVSDSSVDYLANDPTDDRL